MRRHTFNIKTCRWEKASRKRERVFFFLSPSSKQVECMNRFVLDGNGRTGSDEKLRRKFFKRNNVALCLYSCVGLNGWIKYEEKNEHLLFLFHDSFQGNGSLSQLVRNYFISLRFLRLLTHHLLMGGCYSPLRWPTRCTPNFPCAPHGKKTWKLRSTRRGFFLLYFFFLFQQRGLE